MSLNLNNIHYVVNANKIKKGGLIMGKTGNNAVPRSKEEIF